MAEQVGDRDLFSQSTERVGTVRSMPGASTRERLLAGIHDPDEQSDHVAELTTVHQEVITPEGSGGEILRARQRRLPPDLPYGSGGPANRTPLRLVGRGFVGDRHDTEYGQRGSDRMDCPVRTVESVPAARSSTRRHESGE